jgi:hypothetical protein
MSAAIRVFKVEPSLEARVARLEEKTDHLQSDVTAMKADIRGLKDAVAALRIELRDSIAALRIEMKDGFAAINTGRLRDKIWWLLMTATLLGVMARGFKWI